MPSTAPETMIREFWSHFDRKDYEALSAMIADDAQWNDDFSHDWVRGRSAIAQHLGRIGELASDSHTSLSDISVLDAGEAVIVTCVVDYQMAWRGQPASVRAPTSPVVRTYSATA